MNILISFDYYSGKDSIPFHSAEVFTGEELKGINLIKNLSTLERLIEVKLEKYGKNDLHTFSITDIQVIK